MAEAVSTHLPSDEERFASRKTLRMVLERGGWTVMALLLFVGLASVINRMLFLAEAQSVADPAAVYSAFDVRYAQLAVTSWLHLLPALIIAIAGPLQFVRAVRKRWPTWHRLAGRCYLIAGLVGATTGFIIGGLNPFTGLSGPGFNEAVATGVFSAYIIWALAMAYLCVRRRDFARHREYMMRSWSLMMAIATERILLLVLEVTTDVEIAILFGTTFWLAGAINVAVVEAWISLTRTPGRGFAHWKDLDQRASA